MRFFPTCSSVRAGVAAVACAIVAVGALAATPEEIVAERRAGFKHIGEVAKSMKEGVGAGADVTPFAAGAGDIAA